MSTTKLVIDGVYDARCEVRVSANRHAADLSRFDSVATVTVGSGAFGLQTYLTPAECEELASMLLLAAKEVRDLIATPTQQVAA